MKKIKYSKCVRCGSVAIVWTDFGKIGMLGLCSVCWIGLAGAMARDYHGYMKFDEDWLKPLAEAEKRRNWFKEKDRKLK